MGLQVGGKVIVQCAALTAQDCTVHVNPSERLHIMHACGSETFKHSSLTQEPSRAKPAAQQMMVGGVPEESNGDGGVFVF